MGNLERISTPAPPSWSSLLRRTTRISENSLIHAGCCPHQIVDSNASRIVYVPASESSRGTEQRISVKKDSRADSASELGCKICAWKSCGRGEVR